MLLLFMSADGQYYLLPQQEVINRCDEIKTYLPDSDLRRVLYEEHCCISSLEGQLLLATILLQREPASTKEDWSLGAISSNPSAGFTCIIVTYMDAVCTMSSAAEDLPLLAASSPPLLTSGFI